MPVPYRPVSLSAFSDQVLTIYSTGRHARKTFLRVRQVLREFDEMGLRSTSELTIESLARWIKLRGPDANANTINGLLSTASAICSLAVEEGQLHSRPNFRRLRMRGSPAVRNVPRRFEEITRLLEYLQGQNDAWSDRRLSALAWTVALTGSRLGEALHAWTTDVDLDQAVLRIEPRRRLKTVASARTVPLPSILVGTLRPWLAEADTQWLFPGVRRRGPWNGGSVGQRSLDHLKRAASAVGIERITWHSLRHAYGTYALERWEIPLWIVQRVMGHTDVRTTQRYLHLDGSPAIARATRTIEYGPQPQPAA